MIDEKINCPVCGFEDVVITRIEMIENSSEKSRLFLYCSKCNADYCVVEEMATLVCKKIKTKRRQKNDTISNHLQ